MNRVLKWLGLAVAALIVVLMLGGAWSYFRLKDSLPQLDGRITVAGLTGEVEILRDGHAVPHIYADSVEDALFALGYVHAQDRLWQMHMQRTIAGGRLSELVGGRALVLDRFMRAFQFRYYAAAAYERLPEEVKRGLTAYAAGVNAVISARGRPLPPEFFLLQTTPEPWRPTDTLMVGKLLAVGLSTNAFSEVMRARLKEILNPEQLAQFLPPYPGDAPVALPDLAAAVDDTPIKRFANLLPASWTWTASNNWVVSGARTVSGKPLLANDPHLGLTVPSVWYLAHLSVGGRNLIGGTMPGLAGVLVGRTDRIAWGVTNTGADVQDLYLEKVNPDNPDEYLTPDGWWPFEKHVETFRVRFGKDVTEPMLVTRHGPVMPLDWPGLKETAPEGHVLALAWTALREDDLTAAATHAVWHSRDWASFRDGLRAFSVPMQNFVYADVDGDIGFIAPALVPVRSPKNDTLGLQPAPGWEAAYDWQGFIPFDELPQIHNPKSGKVVTANHKIVPDSYPHLITADWEKPYRARRIEEVLAARPKHDVESFRKLQMDNVSTFARDVLPIMLAAEPQGEAAKRAHAMLSGWNFSMNAGRPEPLIYAAWYRALVKAVYADELGEESKLFNGPRPIMMTSVLRGKHGAARWCDDVTTTDIEEDCPSRIALALDEALKELRGKYGHDMADWRWDKPHRAVHSHRPFGVIPLLRSLFNVETPTSGGIYTVNRGHYRFNGSRPYAHVHGSGYRAIYDMANPDKSIFIISTGQSGNPYSPHYADMTKDWAAGRYLPMTTNRADIKAATEHTLVLTPHK